jgi:tRNA(Ile)-lysidine synthase
MRLAPPGLDSLESRNFRLSLAVPGTVQPPGGCCRIEVELIEAQSLTVNADSGYNEEVNGLDWEQISGPLELRNWRPGDQYRPAGHSSEEKIKVLFQRAKVPLWERRNWPVITSGETIIWARRFGPASNLAATSHTRAVLRIREVAV